MYRLPTIAVLLVFASLASASNPTFETTRPRGGQRGTEVKVQFYGTNLTDAKELFKYDDHFEVVKLEVVNKLQVSVTLKIKDDCPLGEHYFRLRCESGITEMRTFWVGPFPSVEEKEPNDDFAAPQMIPLNVTVHGIITNEDVDYFGIELKKGQRLSLEIEAMRLGEAFFDPYIAILDSKRFELASSDDSPLFAQDGVLSIVAPADGKYVVQVRETAYRGGGNSHYRLHVHTAPRPLGVLPVGGKPGEEIEVTFLGDATGPLKRKTKVPMRPLHTKAFLFADEDGKTAASGVPFRISDLPNFMQIEPNNSIAAATKGAIPGAFNGIVGKPGETSYFRFPAKKGEVYDFQVYARQLGSILDSVLTLYNDKGGALASNDDTNGPDSYFRYQIPADGEYVLGIRDHLLKGGPTYFYRIEVDRVQPHTELTTAKPVQYSQERQAIAVPRGNRFAILVAATRRDWGGDMAVSWDALPAKVKAVSETMPGNSTVVPVVFEAEADAPMEARFLTFLAKPIDAKVNALSDFHQTPELILGQNNSSFWSPRLPKAAIAVTKEVPFTVKIIEPKVPMVHNGTLNLKVVAERKGDFKGAITVVPLYNPPGVGSVGSATIPEGQTETLFAMNANPGAVARPWKYALQATANVGDGPVWVSTQLATFEISKPYVSLVMERGVVEQGKETKLFVKIAVQTPFEGKAKIRLTNLPPKTTAEEMEVDKDTKEVAFTIKAEAAAPVGIHRNIFCNFVITKDGEPIPHTFGTTELRIDAPVVAKNPAPATPVPNQPAAKPDQPVKRLTRLEQLRLEQEQREKAGKEEKKDK